MPSIATRQPAPTPVTDGVPLPPRLLPDLPADVLERFPSLVDWNENGRRGWTRAYQALQNSNRDISQNITQTKETAKTFRAAYNEFVAEVTEEISVIANEQGAQARRLITVSAMAGVNSNISVQSTPPMGPAVNDYWIDTSNPLLPTTYQWSGTDWVEVTTPISYAGVAEEQEARVFADGNLSGKYSLNVIAGDVITSLNISSASGPGVNVSNVAWTADQFLIYSGTTKKQMFFADGVQDVVRLANLFTVDGGNNRLYAKTTAGAGAFNNANTPIYFDIVAGVGRMSLGTRLTWDGSNLAINGTVTATAGQIGGWTIAATTLSGGNAVLDSTGQLILGTANDVVFLSANDATYRLWVGNVTAGSATFSVSKTGQLFSTAGRIGGFTIGSDTLSFTDGTGAYTQLRANGVPTIAFGAPGGGETLTVRYDALQVKTAGGANLITVGSTSLDCAVPAFFNQYLRSGNGSTSAPTYSFQSDTDTGWRWNSSGDMRAVTNGSDRLVVRDGAVVLLVPLKLDNAFVAGAPAATGYVTVQDLAGTTYRLLCAP